MIAGGAVHNRRCNNTETNDSIKHSDIYIYMYIYTHVYIYIYIFCVIYVHDMMCVYTSLSL